MTGRVPTPDMRVAGHPCPATATNPTHTTRSDHDHTPPRSVVQSRD